MSRLSLQAMLTLFVLVVTARSNAENPAGPSEQTPSVTSQTDAPNRSSVDFVRDIQPIFAKHCHRCHGRSKHEGGLRLDSRVGALEGGDNGRMVKPGRSDQSMLIARVISDDDSVRMPLEARPLSPKEIAALRRWIDAGAIWPEAAQRETQAEHWSFTPPERPVPPAVRDTAWVRNPIDNFVLARLEAEGLEPSPEADRYTLIRRLSLDLIGLPPTPAATDAFVNDQRHDAYEKLVDRLLDSPHYGERWARSWLDLARYADTNGYEKDRPRSIWAFRNWVIDALNADMPFDQFTIEQIAGDMLPDAGLSQRIATGFHRNTMLNQEGGIDPQEDRFKRIVDRIGTTGTTWLGLTIGCAQCHSHKYDPITQREYYKLFALLNNADEVELSVSDVQVAAKRAEVEARIAAIEADLANRFPVPPSVEWGFGKLVQAESSGGAEITRQPDDSLVVSGADPDSDTYTIVVDTTAPEISAVRLEALVDRAFPNRGPGRAGDGNFVVSELQVSAASLSDPDDSVPVTLQNPQADFSQVDQLVTQAVDGKTTGAGGWAIRAHSNHWNVNRTATFEIRDKVGFAEGTRLTFVIHQQHGTMHTLGRFRVSFGRPVNDNRSTDERRSEHVEHQFVRWQDQAATRARRWTILRPRKVEAKTPSLTVLDDSSVLVGGDAAKRDVFELEFDTALANITALRLEALPHPTLPGGGPGREAIDHPGNFFLSEVDVRAGRKGEIPPLSRDVEIAGTAHSYASPDYLSDKSIDHDEESSWSIDGGTGRAQIGVFEFREPISGGADTTLNVVLTHFRYYPASLGRFRVSITTGPTPPRLSTLPAEIESLLLVPRPERTRQQHLALRSYYLSTAPELAPEHARIAELRQSLPAFPTTLVMQERMPVHARTTHHHHRGEYPKQGAVVDPNVPDVLHPLPDDAPRNRLTLARWLVDQRNPLVARVVMNRHWATLFGRGIVRTTEDFGTQGAAPTHPELLDWLAAEFMQGGWSRKALHRRIVTSAVYRQSSQVSPELLRRDPQNLLLARSPRLRVDAETVRDITLCSAGLLTPRIGGPSVFPPQPEAITASAFGMLAWKAETGENRYRRGLYTFAKRTAPFAAFAVFDAPSGEACVVRRERSNTPLQALTLMNDTVFVEASQALARRVFGGPPRTTNDRLTALFRLCLTRPPTARERQQMQQFLDEQLVRFRSGELNPIVVGGGTLKRWTFEKAADGWQEENQCRLAVNDGALQITTTGDDPQIVASVRGSRGRAVLKLRARFRNSGAAQVYWITEAKPGPEESNSITFEPRRHEWAEYVVDINANSNLTGLRFDPGNSAGEVDIDWIDLSYCRLRPVETDPCELAAWTALARVLLNLDATISRG